MPSGGGRHSYTPHANDWNEGDPVWKGSKGKNLIGALNYLAGKGMTAFSFLTYNRGGDGKDVWPFVTRDSLLQYDCSKLDQWEIVFEHADSLGLFLHFKTQETENDRGQWGLDAGYFIRLPVLCPAVSLHNRTLIMNTWMQ